MQLDKINPAVTKYSRRVTSCCSTNVTRNVTLVKIILHEESVPVICTPEHSGSPLVISGVCVAYNNTHGGYH
jgi:hypothetical protein